MVAWMQRNSPFNQSIETSARLVFPDILIIVPFESHLLVDGWETPFVAPNGSPLFIGNMFREYGYQWVDLRENLQETIDFHMKYGSFL